jgi:YD repeat-containing protein
MEPSIPYVAYKATYNFKCRNQVYHVGKTYISPKLQMCAHGIHFCLNMQDTIKFYEPTNKFVLLEIAVLGTVQTDGCKSVTDKIKVLRVVPKEEYTKQMLDAMTAFEYDDHGNLIKETHNDFEFYKYTYDERGNKLTMADQDGDIWKYEYDENNRLVAEVDFMGCRDTYEYDERGNQIARINQDGSKTIFEYDNNNNHIRTINRFGDVRIIEQTGLTEED